MRPLDRYFIAYDAFHTHPHNKLTHYVGIPLIVIAVLGLFSRVSANSMALVRLDGAVVLWALASAWYIRLDPKLGASFALFLSGFYFLGRALPGPWLWAFFAVGWVLQLIGHYRYEKKSPAFMQNFEHLLIGPFWIFARILK